MDPFLDEPENQNSGFDPLAMLRLFWRRKLLFFIPFIICLAMAGVAIKTMTPIFYSSGQIQIKMRTTSSRLLDDPANQYGGRRRNDIDAVVFHEMGMLISSHEFLDKIVHELGLQDALNQARVASDAAPLEEGMAVRRARNKLDSMIRLRRNGYRLFRMGVRDPDPYQAHRLAEYILERFVDEYRASQAESGASTRVFWQNQLETHSRNLENSEQALNDFQAGLASAALAGNPINAVNLNTAESNLATLRDRFNGPDALELGQLGQAARAVLGASPTVDTYHSDPTVRTTLAELADKELEANLHVAGSRAATDLEPRKGQIRVRLRSLLDSMIAQRLPNLGFMDRNRIGEFVYFSLYRTALGEVIGRLDGDINEFRDFTARQPQQSSRLAELQSAVTRNRGMVDDIVEEIAQYDLNDAAGRSEVGVRILTREAPELNLVPVEPDKIKLMAMGVILSLGIGIGLVILAILLDRSFNSVEGIERALGVTVIGTLPMIKDEHFERKKKIRYLRWLTIVLGILAVGAVGFLVVYPRLG